MSQVAVQKIHSNETQSSAVIDEMKSLFDRIRERAYELFESRGRTDGSALNDWLAAENDLLMIPESDLVETDGRFEMQVAVSGFDAKDIEVDALPDALIVRAQNTHEHEQTNGNVQFCEFGQKSLFRRFDLPAPINVDLVNANVDKGSLKVTAPKAEAKQSAHATA
jgi:HSP20 family molecular chaperone IbpA